MVIARLQSLLLLLLLLSCLSRFALAAATAAATLHARTICTITPQLFAHSRHQQNSRSHTCIAIDFCSDLLIMIAQIQRASVKAAQRSLHTTAIKRSAEIGKAAAPQLITANRYELQCRFLPVAALHMKLRLAHAHPQRVRTSISSSSPLPLYSNGDHCCENDLAFCWQNSSSVMKSIDVILRSINETIAIRLAPTCTNTHCIPYLLPLVLPQPHLLPLLFLLLMFPPLGTQPASLAGSSVELLSHSATETTV